MIKPKRIARIVRETLDSYKAQEELMGMVEDNVDVAGSKEEFLYDYYWTRGTNLDDISQAGRLHPDNYRWEGQGG